jgi:hypothetical protein
MEDIGKGISLDELILAKGRMQIKNNEFAIEALDANLTLNELIELLGIKK